MSEGRGGDGRGGEGRGSAGQCHFWRACIARPFQLSLLCLCRSTQVHGVQYNFHKTLFL